KPYEINPDMPQEGLSRRAYRTKKFGTWERSQAMDAEILQAAQSLGTEFRFDRVEIAPNTRRAHLLMALAERRLGLTRADAVVEAIFSAYFTHGRNIGEIDVLIEATAPCGLDRDEIRRVLEAREGEGEFLAMQEKARNAGIRALPTVFIDGQQVS